MNSFFLNLEDFCFVLKNNKKNLRLKKKENPMGNRNQKRNKNEVEIKKKEKKQHS